MPPPGNDLPDLHTDDFPARDLPDSPDPGAVCANGGVWDSRDPHSVNGDHSAVVTADDQLIA